MKKLEIDCKGICDVSFDSGRVTLECVDMSFLEDLDSSLIINNHNNQKLLEAMDQDEIDEWYENRFGVTVINNSENVNQEEETKELSIEDALKTDGKDVYYNGVLITKGGLK